jgi:hypothetical protein
MANCSTFASEIWAKLFSLELALGLQEKVSRPRKIKGTKNLMA